MGFLAGVVGELNRREDAAERREEFMMNLLEKRKAAVLPQVMDRIEKRNAAVAERSARVKTANIKYNITTEAAAVLESTGELSPLLESLSQEKTVSRSAIETLSEAAVANLKPEQIGAAMKYAFDAGYASEPTSEKLVEAIYANTQEDFSSALEALMSSTTGGGKAPSIDPLGLNRSAFGALSETRIANIRKNIEDSLASRLGYDKNKSTKDGYVWTDPESANDIINNAERFYVEQITDVVAQRNPEDIMRQIVTSVEYLKDESKLSLQDITEFDQFPTDSVPQKPMKNPLGNDGTVVIPSSGSGTGTVLGELGVDTSVGGVFDAVEKEDQDKEGN
jgi:hypothetical protein